MLFRLTVVCSICLSELNSGGGTCDSIWMLFWSRPSWSYVSVVFLVLETERKDNLPSRANYK